MKKFYSHIVEIESIIIKLDEMDLTDEQKHHLASLVDSTIHHTVLDLVLSKLSKEDKESFLQKMQEDPENKELMDFLNEKIDGIEDEIKKVIGELKKELHEDMEEAKRRK